MLVEKQSGTQTHLDRSKGSPSDRGDVTGAAKMLSIAPMLSWWTSATKNEGIGVAVMKGGIAGGLPADPGPFAKGHLWPRRKTTMPLASEHRRQRGGARAI